MTRLAAFVITYRRTEAVADTVRRLLSQSRPPDHVLVVDNGSSPETEAALREFGDRRVEYRAMEGNLGPAGAAAHALESLRGAGFDWILWGDDDNPPATEDTLERLLAIPSSAEATAEAEIGGVAATGVRWDWRRGETRLIPDDQLDGILDIDAAGGNQCLMLRSSIFEEVGLPDPKLFFGLEEMEYCLRIRRAGYRLLVDGELLHRYREHFGQLGRRPRRLPARRHPLGKLWRRYYNSRNYIYLMRTTFGRPDLAWRETAKALLRAAACWRHGFRYGWRYSRLQLAGVRDGFAGRMGRTVDPEGYSR